MRSLKSFCMKKSIHNFKRIFVHLILGLITSQEKRLFALSHSLMTLFIHLLQLFITQPQIRPRIFDQKKKKPQDKCKIIGYNLSHKISSTKNDANINLILFYNLAVVACFRRRSSPSLAISNLRTLPLPVKGTFAGTSSSPSQKTCAGDLWPPSLLRHHSLSSANVGRWWFSASSTKEPTTSP